MDNGAAAQLGGGYPAAARIAARVGIASHSVGIGALAGDRLGELGVPVPPLAEATRAFLDEILAERGWAGNPADVTGKVTQPTFARTLDLMLGDPNIDVVVVETSGRGNFRAHRQRSPCRRGRPVRAMGIARRRAQPYAGCSARQVRADTSRRRCMRWDMLSARLTAWPPRR